MKKVKHKTMYTYTMFLLVILTCTLIAIGEQLDPSRDQISLFKEQNQYPVGIMTTSAGRPIDYQEATCTLNKRLIFNQYFMDSITHLNRERIPERVVHAVGSGAFGYFEVTHDITNICKANLFSNVGKRTQIAVRFSPVRVERGGGDTGIGPRGFAVKFYTEEGNLDLVGFNTPIFHFKDPLLFPSFIHAIKRNPATNLIDYTMFWDFFTLHPETFHILMYNLADSGIPDGYRHMPGYSVHTFQVVNNYGGSYFVRFHFEPDSGRNYLTVEENRKLDPNHFHKDLYDAIAEGNYPSWTVYIQVLTWDEVKNATFDVFDVSRILPEDKYPKRPLGRIVLTRNPVNYFAEVEQLAFCPSNLVPGILGAPDKMFEARRFAYKDTQRYRLGVNSMNTGVNSPKYETYTYNRDGHAPGKYNQGDIPNYYPNSFNGPVPYNAEEPVELVDVYQTPAYNLDQSRKLYASYSPEEQKRLLNNALYTLKLVPKFIQERAIEQFGLIDEKLGEDVKEGLNAIKRNP